MAFANRRDVAGSEIKPFVVDCVSAANSLSKHEISHRCWALRTASRRSVNYGLALYEGETTSIPTEVLNKRKNYGKPLSKKEFQQNIFKCERKVGANSPFSCDGKRENSKKERERERERVLFHEGSVKLSVNRKILTMKAETNLQKTSKKPRTM